MATTAPRDRASILLPRERIAQLKILATLEECTATEYLEDLIRVRARKKEIGLPGFKIGYTDTGNLALTFSTPDSDELIFPWLELTPAEAQRIADHMKAVLRGAGPSARPAFKTEVGGHFIEVYRKAKGVVLHRYTDQGKGKEYKKSFTRSLAKDVIEWLEAGASQAEKH